MEYAIQVEKLSKHYKDFSLKDVNFAVPMGTIVGFVGENGAGKTTTLKAILGCLRLDSGKITVLGGEPTSNKVLAQVGVVFEDAFFYEDMTSNEVGRCLAGIQPGFNKGEYTRLLSAFSLPGDKLIKEMSRGMRMKLRLAAALAHKPRLLILDEATSGLDPVMRSEMLDILRDYIQDEAHSVLISSHITSDLEKIADSIVYIQNGHILFQMNKDELMEDYGIVRGSESQLALLPDRLIAARRRSSFGCEALVKNRREVAKQLPGAVIDRATIDEIMEFYARRDKQ